MERPRLLRNDALTDPRFWAMHYYLLIGTEEIDTGELIEPFFGVSNETVNDYYVREFDISGPEEIWPYLEVSVRDGCTVQVEYAGTASETRFYINHEKWSQPVCLGYESGHFALPAFRWSEVEAIRRACAGINAARALLLVFPAVWICTVDDANEIRSALVEAWGQIGVIKSDRLEELANQIIEHRSAEVRWWTDPRLGWITDGQYSFRNPKTLMCEFYEDRFAKVAAFLAGIETPR